MISLLEQHLEFLSCPSCNNSLSLEIYKKFSDNKRIMEGILLCSCGLWYPIINGVPRLLTGKLRHLITLYHADFIKRRCNDRIQFDDDEIDKIQERTARIHDEIKPLSSVFKVHDDWEKPWIEPLTAKFFEDKIILDAGCRLGNHTYFAAKYGAKLVIGIDIGQTVEYAFDTNKEMDNVLIIQADLQQIPTQKIFDLIICIGVLHHLPEPQKGFKKLINKAKQGATLLIWVYNYNHYKDLKLLFFLRKFTIHSIQICKMMSWFHTKFLRFRMKIYELKLKRFNGNSDPFFDYLRQFGSDNTSNYVFNQLSAPIAFYFKKNELENWFKINEIHEYKIFNFWNHGWKSIIKLS